MAYLCFFLFFIAVGAGRSAVAQEMFPPLPASNPCKPGDVIGIWSLVHVYEVPMASEAAQAAANPVQYLLFDANSFYGRYNAGRTQLTPPQVREQIYQHATGVQQYVVQASGDHLALIYFYANSVAFDTQACFIVASPLGAFNPGEMLLMPPEGQVQGRLLKVYTKISPPAQPRKGR